MASAKPEQRRPPVPAVESWTRKQVTTWFTNAVAQLRVIRSTAVSLHPLTPQPHLPLSSPFSFPDHGKAVDALIGALDALHALNVEAGKGLGPSLGGMPAAVDECVREVIEFATKIDRIAFDEASLPRDRAQLRGWLVLMHEKLRPGQGEAAVRENRGAWLVDAIVSAIVPLDPERLAARFHVACDSVERSREPFEFTDLGTGSSIRELRSGATFALSRQQFEVATAIYMARGGWVSHAAMKLDASTASRCIKGIRSAAKPFGQLIKSVRGSGYRFTFWDTERPVQ